MVTEFIYPQPVGGSKKLYEGVRFPKGAKLQSAQGTVILDVYVDETGKVRFAEIIESPGYQFSLAARNAVLKAALDPGYLNVKPIKSVTRVPVFFVQH